MPAKNSDCDSSSSTCDQRASNCSLRLRRNAGQCSAPGTMSLSAANIWQPLQTPSAKRSGFARNGWNSRRPRSLKRMVFAQDRKRVVSGRRVAEQVDVGGDRIIKKKKKQNK